MNNHILPKAPKQPKELSIHGDNRIDNYFWMRLSDEQKESKNPDKQTQNVIDYLNAENDYLKQKMGHTDKLQKALFQEIGEVLDCQDTVTLELAIQALLEKESLNDLIKKYNQLVNHNF